MGLSLTKKVLLLSNMNDIISASEMKRRFLTKYNGIYVERKKDGTWKISTSMGYIYVDVECLDYCPSRELLRDRLRHTDIVVVISQEKSLDKETLTYISGRSPLLRSSILPNIDYFSTLGTRIMDGTDTQGLGTFTGILRSLSDNKDLVLVEL